MKKIFLFLLLGAICLLSSNSLAVTFDFATGQDSSGNIQTTANSKDANWTATGGISTYVTTSSNADWYGNWSDISSSNSSWIAPFPNSASGNGLVSPGVPYSYTYSFDLSGYNLSTAVFSGMKFSIDDGGTVFLNGNNLSQQSWGGGSYYFQDFSVPISDLVAGPNTLTVVEVSGTDNYLEAMRLEGTLQINQSTVPEPCAMLLFGSGLVGLAAYRKKFRA